MFMNGNMTLNDYQIISKETAKFPKDVALFYLALGINGEAGEVADKVKKYFRGDYNKNLSDQETIDKAAELLLKWDVANELGDVLWYVAMLADYFDITLEEIAIRNNHKLQSRLARDVINGNGDNR